VSISQSQSEFGNFRQLDTVLVVSVTLLITAAPLLPLKAAIAAASGTAVLAVLAWNKRCRGAAPLSAFCVICFGLVLAGVRYFPLVLAPWSAWLRRGRARSALVAGNSDVGSMGIF
jgi:hypothetical protein